MYALGPTPFLLESVGSTYWMPPYARRINVHRFLRRRVPDAAEVRRRQIINACQLLRLRLGA